MSSTKITEFDLDTSADIAKESTLRENFETIDTLMSENEAVANEINSKIGTPTESGQTLFSLLESNSSDGLTAIKSLQRISVSISEGKTSTTATIKTVDPTKCIIIFERLKDGSNSSAVDYTLNATSLVITHAELSNSYTLKVGFWIIEFY